ncbi:MAG: type II toxin-antitoxin system Phd/YefM family antitoxin [Solirubrobacteraceae bacterium]|jgi:antitoxin YefM
MATEALPTAVAETTGLPIGHPKLVVASPGQIGFPGSAWSANLIDDRTDVRHNCGVTSQPLRSVRDHLSEIVDRVEREHDRVVITRNGREVAVLLSAADFAELEETLSVLSDPQALADIREADFAYARGDVIRGVDAVRALRS